MGERLEKAVPARFYKSASGKEPVRDWLRALAPEDRRAIGYDIAEIEFGWPIGMPLCRSLRRGLWEIRSNISGGRIARVIFCLVEEEMILLHSFIKKSQKTPKRDLDLAARRMKELKG